MTVGPPSTLAAGSSFLLEWALTSQPEIETALRALTAEVRHLELELTRRIEHEQQRAAEAAAAARSEPEGAHEGAQSAARQRLRAALERLVRMLPSAASASTSSPNGNAAAEAAPAPAAASAQYSASRERREEVLVAEALEGALRAQKFHREKVDECRRLRASVRRQSDRSGFVTSFVTHGFRFDDRVAFVRRASVPGGSVAAGLGGEGGWAAEGSVAAGGRAAEGCVAAVEAGLGASGQHALAAGSKATALHPLPVYVALRQGAAGPPYFLSRASEESLCRAMHCTQASLPPVAIGKVVHVEKLHASPENAAALGLRPGAPFNVITAEMLTDLAPEVTGR